MSAQDDDAARARVDAALDRWFYRRVLPAIVAATVAANLAMAAVRGWG